MPVYFIQSGENGAVKIGYAVDPERRLKLLQIGTPASLRIIRTIEGDRLTESAAHKRFAEHRITGEWFRYHQDMMTATFAERAPKSTGSDFVRSIAREHGVSEDTLKKMGRRGLPHKYRLPIYFAAQQRGVTLTAADFGGVAA